MTRVLFDMHTSAANSLNGKFNNLTRFAECLDQDPDYQGEAVYDRADGADVPIPHHFLRQWYFTYGSDVELRLRWARYLAKSDADWLWTEIIPGRHSANPIWMPSRFTRENTVLHVDFQKGDMINQAHKIRRHSRFHVLTQIQCADLMDELGVDRDQVHVIPNPVDIPRFRDDQERNRTILYVDGRDSNVRVLYHNLPPDLKRHLRVIDSEHRVGQEDYVRLLNTASMAICLT